VDGFDGFTLATIPIGGVFFNIDALIGSSAGNTDRLLGVDAIASWTITAINAGTYAEGGRSLPFTSFEFLLGGAAEDTFILNAGTQITGRINGAGSADVLRAVGSAGGDSMILRPWRLTLNALDSLFSEIEAIQLRGEAGNDRFTIRFDGGNPVPAGGASVTGGPGGDLLSTIGSMASDTMNLSPTMLRVNAATIGYSTLEQMDLFAGRGNDVFNALFVSYQPALANVRFFGELGNDRTTLAPSTTTRFFIHGGPPAFPTFPGDALFFVPMGQVIQKPVLLSNGGANGLYNFKNRKSVQFVSIEEGVGGHLDIQPWL
jgi:hypothetical protein